LKNSLSVEITSRPLSRTAFLYDSRVLWRGPTPRRAPYGPGSLLYNPPQKSHRLTTGDHEPTLLAYAWVGPDEQLHNQKLHFSRPPRED